MIKSNEEIFLSQRSLKSKSLLIVVSVFVVSLIVFLFVYFFVQRSTIDVDSKKAKLENFPSTRNLSLEEIDRLTTLKDFLNLSSIETKRIFSRSSINMEHFMRSAYDENLDSSSEIVDSTDYFLALPNRFETSSRRNVFHFDSKISLKNLRSANLILPVENLSKIRVNSSKLKLILSQPCQIEHRWCKINLTKFFKHFPFRFSLTSIDEQENDNEQFSSLSDGFLLLKFSQSTSDVDRRIFSNEEIVHFPSDSSICQVHPFRISFSKISWSSSIIEPNFYEMNLCAGTCSANSNNIGIYSIISNFLHEKSAQNFPKPCCQPKRFGSTLFLYYDDVNLVLRRHENTRVLECSCSF